MHISSAPWDEGVVGGQAVSLYTLSNDHGMTVKISDYGGVVQSIWVPDRGGRLVNVALGFPTCDDYVADFTQGVTSTPWPMAGGSGNTYFGAIVGRHANRIASHSFTMHCRGPCTNDGQTYRLDDNDGPNTLHGGHLGWNSVVWDASMSNSNDAVSLALTHLFPAGEGCESADAGSGNLGFPADVLATVTYWLTNGNELGITYHAVNQSPTEATVINLTNHTYFNLAGEGSGSVENQLLALNADRYTPVDTSAIPQTPYFVPVAGTPFDFRTLKPIGRDIRALEMPDGVGGTPYGPFGEPPGPFHQLVIAHGYDHNWVLNGSGYRLVSVAADPDNGIVLSTFTDQPGAQVYTANFLVGDLSGLSERPYRQTSAFALETQHYPDSPHHIGDPMWPSVVLSPGQPFDSTTSFRFSTADGGFERHVRF